MIHSSKIAKQPFPIRASSWAASSRATASYLTTLPTTRFDFAPAVVQVRTSYPAQALAVLNVAHRAVEHHDGAAMNAIVADLRLLESNATTALRADCLFYLALVMCNRQNKVRDCNFCFEFFVLGPDSGEAVPPSSSRSAQHPPTRRRLALP